MPRDKKYRHLVKSEICNEEGAWSKLCLKFGEDIEKEIKRIAQKYEGKISLDAMAIIINSTTWMSITYLKAMSSFNTPRKSKTKPSKAKQ